MPAWAEVKLTHPSINSGTPVTVICNRVLIGGQTNIIHKPTINGTDVCELQKQGFDNPSYTLENIMLTNDANTFTYAHLLTLYRARFAGVSSSLSAATLNVKYGTNQTLVAAGATASTNIPVLLESFNLPIDATDTKDGYLPFLTATFRETK